MALNPRARILVIEDEPDLLENIAGTLVLEGYEVVRARGGREGIEAVRKSAPDLVLCDVMMPDVDGHSVLQAVRADAATTMLPFVFLTARVLPDDQRSAMEMGADDYLTKPFSIDRLLAAVSSRLEKNRKENEANLRKIEIFRDALRRSMPHELLTPISLIRTAASRLKDGGERVTEEQRNKLLETILEGTRRLERMTKNNLLYAQVEAAEGSDPELRSFFLRGETSMPSDHLRVTAEKIASMWKRLPDLCFEVKLPQGAGLRLPQEHFCKILEEPLRNAFSFSEAGTPVTVAAHVSSGMLVIEISDRGRGMTAEEVAAIGLFMQFNRRFFEQQGGGMGLALAIRLASFHSGELSVDSSPQKGTRIRLRLPLAGEMTAPNKGTLSQEKGQKPPAKRRVIQP